MRSDYYLHDNRDLGANGTWCRSQERGRCDRHGSISYLLGVFDLLSLAEMAVYILIYGELPEFDDYALPSRTTHSRSIRVSWIEQLLGAEKIYPGEAGLTTTRI